jgi:hypothetical protein
MNDEVIKPHKASRWVVAGIVLIALLLLGSIFLSPLNRVKNPDQIYSCITVLRTIDGAAHQFALEHNLTNGSPINFPSDLTPYLRVKSDGTFERPCPAGGTYSIKEIGDVPTCSIGGPGHTLLK